MARRPSGSRRYPRTARLNEVVREIVADEIRRIDDERLGFLTITAVEVDPGIEQAKVYWSNIDVPDDEVIAVLEEHRAHLQATVNAQTHMRRTPRLLFLADEVDRAGSRIDEILADLPPAATDGNPDDDTTVDTEET